VAAALVPRRLLAYRQAPPGSPPEALSPRQVTGLKALACEAPAAHARPLSRLFIPDIVARAQAEGLVDRISCATVWRLLDADALKPWRHRSWIYPRDPAFYARAAPVLDLYAGRWRGQPLGPRDFVICADEKTSIQARRRLHPATVGADGRGQRVEHEYARHGAWAYLAAWDVHRGRLFDRVEATTGSAPFLRLVAQVMAREPYRSARRVFWITDNGSAHHPSTFPARLEAAHPTAIAVRLPVHASWLNQVEIYFSVVQRRALTPNDFADLAAARERLLAFGQHFNARASPFAWRYTRQDLRRLLARLEDQAA
jgi:hypothetical protein